MEAIAIVTILALLQFIWISVQVGSMRGKHKVKAPAIPRLIAETQEQIKKNPAAFPEVIATSSEKNDGLHALREAIASAINP